MPTPDADTLLSEAERAILSGDMSAAKALCQELEMCPYNSIPERYRSFQSYVAALEQLKAGKPASAYYAFSELDDYLNGQDEAKRCLSTLLEQYEVSLKYSIFENKAISALLTPGELRAANTGDGNIRFMLAYTSSADMNIMVNSQPDGRLFQRDLEETIHTGEGELVFEMPIEDMLAAGKLYGMNIWFIHETNEKNEKERLYIAIPAHSYYGDFRPVVKLCKLDIVELLEEVLAMEKSESEVAASAPTPTPTGPSETQARAQAPKPSSTPKPSTTPKPGSAPEPSQNEGTGTRDWSVMPDFVGKKPGSLWEEMKKHYSSFNFYREYNDEYPAGYVYKTEPAAGQKITGAPSLWVSLGPAPSGSDMQTFPNVVGMSRDEAISTLKSLGFKPNTGEVYSDTVPKGYVVKQYTEAGAQVDMRLNSGCYIEISKGPQG